MKTLGGTNTLQPLPRIISIQPTGSAYQSNDLRVGQLISEVDGFKLSGKEFSKVQVCLQTHYVLLGLPHETAAKLIAECFARKDKPSLTLVIMDQKLTPAEMRRSFMQPQN